MSEQKKDISLEHRIALLETKFVFLVESIRDGRDGKRIAEDMDAVAIFTNKVSQYYPTQKEDDQNGN